MTDGTVMLGRNQAPSLIKTLSADRPPTPTFPAKVRVERKAQQIGRLSRGERIVPPGPELRERS